MIKQLGRFKAILCVLAMIMLIAGCSGENKNENTDVEQSISVKGELVTATSKSLTRSFTGTLEGEQQAVIRAKINEAVESIQFSEGDRV